MSCWSRENLLITDQITMLETIISKIEGKKFTAQFLPMSSSAFASARSAGLDSASLPARPSSPFEDESPSSAFSFEDPLEDGTGSTAISGVTKTGFLVVVGSGPKAVGSLLQLSVVQLNWRINNKLLVVTNSLMWGGEESVLSFFTFVWVRHCRHRILQPVQNRNRLNREPLDNNPFADKRWKI